MDSFITFGLLRSCWRGWCADSDWCFPWPSTHSTVCTSQDWCGCCYTNRRGRCKLWPWTECLQSISVSELYHFLDCSCLISTLKWSQSWRCWLVRQLSRHSWKWWRRRSWPVSELNRYPVLVEGIVISERMAGGWVMLLCMLAASVWGEP